MDYQYHHTHTQQSEDVEMGNANSAMLENIVQTSNCACNTRSRGEMLAWRGAETLAD